MEDRCPACGALIDYCQGHGYWGDRPGWDVLRAHDNGNHTGCHPAGCEVKREAVWDRYHSPTPEGD